MTIGSNVSQCLSSLKSIEAQITTLALNSEDEAAQKAFHEAMLMVGEINKELQNRISELYAKEPQYKNSR